ncbi:TIGR02221 family CRISPR-associated protein [Desulfobulbus elongatus]|uniref:TIGR02221 family CRISPR-associated protein n=1 Tax=Desulfobulbus elongatus TaxID=53332 RepID=UPI0004886138|nr:TIGR02221 family CRISPR-associated protein [Desulfobulbus elongatus]
MAKVFVSFLGTGPYSKAKYCWTKRSDIIVDVRFAQTAILKFLEEQKTAEEPVERLILFCTEKSRKQLPVLEEEMRLHLRTVPDPFPPGVLVPEEMTAPNQWKWFEQLLRYIDQGDTLIIDFTHGFRSVPIVFSSAIGFLRRAKDIKLAHALYAWWDKEEPDKEHPIVDMRDFYVINDWAEAVARLADDADARKLGELAKNTEVESLQPLANEHLIDAFAEMTDCIRNVDVNNIGKKVEAALERVEQARTKTSGSARVMLDLVWNKFSTLSVPTSGRYDQAYFRSQLEIIRVLLEHRLFMQAFTAMRELVGSIGMIGLSGKYSKQMSCADGRKYRSRFAEVFVNLMQYAQDNWRFSDQAATDKEILMPWFNTLQDVGVEPQLRRIVKPLVDTRNGFDHAWTAKAEAQQDVEQQGKEDLTTLDTIITQLVEQRLIS